MATYYVRRTGNDGALGTSPSTAWLTVDKAANTVAAADTVYIGAGVYRELVTMDTSGSAGNLISFIGDIDGAQTGDPGPVIISAHDTETAGAARAAALRIEGKQFIVWENVHFVGGTTAAIQDTRGAGATAYEGCVWRRCGLWNSVTTGRALLMGLFGGAAPGTTGFRFYECVIGGRAIITFDNNAVADIDVDGAFHNCIFTLHPDSASGLLLLYSAGPNTFGVGGIDVINSLFWGAYNGVYGNYLRNTTSPMRVLNSLFCGCENDIYCWNCSNNTVYEDYNLSWLHVATFTAGAVQSGGNTDTSIAPVLMGGLADAMFTNRLGWSFAKPWEPLLSLDGSYVPAPIGFGSAAYAPAIDIYGNPRPLGRNTDDVGAVEANPRGSQETTTVRSGSSSLGMLRGAGYQDKLVQVDASSTTVEVYGRYDANYTGSNPILRVLNIPGVTDQSDAMTGGSGAWEKLECTFTPTSAGFVRVRLESRDTSANGECFFDDLRVK